MPSNFSRIWNLSRPLAQLQQPSISLPPPKKPINPQHPKYGAVPDVLILDVVDEMRDFNEAISHLRVCEFELDEIMSEVILFISDKEFIDTGIEDLAKQFRLIHGRHNDEGDVDLVADGDIMADAVANLAHSLVWRFKELDMYLVDGNLPYAYKESLLGENSFVFTKFLDYKPQVELERDAIEYDPNRWHESRIPDSDPEHVYEGRVVEE